VKFFELYAKVTKVDSHYFSQHPITQKRRVIMHLIDKVFLSYPDLQQKNFSLIINFLLDNSYLLDFIFSCIRKRLATKIHRKNQINTSVNCSHNDYFVISYVKRTSEMFMQFIKIFLILNHLFLISIN